MEKIIAALKEFETSYLEGSAIDKIVIDLPNKKITVSYTHAAKDDEFDSFKDFVNFLHADQNG